MTVSSFRFQAEVRLLRWGESSSAGRTITLELPPDDGAAHPFRGFPTGHTHGQRFRMQFDAIGDDEQLAPQNSPALDYPRAGAEPAHALGNPPESANASAAADEQRGMAGRTAGSIPATGAKNHRPWDTLSPSQQAGILCSDKAFQKFASEKTGWNCDEEDAAAWLRAELDITSRKELDLRPELAPKLDALRAEFMEWAGRVPVAVR